MDASALFGRLSTPDRHQLAGAVETFEEDYLRVVTTPNILRRIAQHTEVTGHNDRPYPTRLGIVQTKAGAKIAKIHPYNFLHWDLQIVHDATLRHVLCRSVSCPHGNCRNTKCVLITCLFFFRRSDTVTGRRQHLAKRRSLNNQAHTLTHTTLIPHIPLLPILTILSHSWLVKSIVFSQTAYFSRKKHLTLPFLPLLRPHSDLSPAYNSVYDSESISWRGQFLARPAAGRVIQ